MNTYIFKSKISTLSSIAIQNLDTIQSFFETKGMKFSNWDDFSRNNFLVSSEVKANNFKEAQNIFFGNLAVVTSRIAFISQCFISFSNESFLITKDNESTFFFRIIMDTDPVGLIFTEEEKEALEITLSKNISNFNNFFYYWNDAVNSISYSAKLLLMFSAIEAITKEDKVEKRNEILGVELADEIWKKDLGLRHRLTHGDYFHKNDSSKNYVKIIHNKIMNYFNKEIFKKDLIDKVIHPQRHFWGNREEMRVFLKPKKIAQCFDFRDMVNVAQKNRYFFFEDFEFIDKEPENF